MSIQNWSTRFALGARGSALLLKAAVIYVGVVFAAGTLINMDRPGAARVGWTLQQMTMINPMIRWADAHDHPHLLDVLVTIADGVPREWLA